MFAYAIPAALSVARTRPGVNGAYWAELRWRTEYANDPDAFRKTVQALLQTSPVPYETLVSRTKTARHA